MLAYKSGSTGEEINLTQEAIRARIKKAGFYDHKWKPEETELENGVQISGFKKEKAEYDLTLDFIGSKQERAENSNRFFELTERDVLENTAGILKLNDYCIECYVTESKSGGRDTRTRMVQRETKIIAPYPFWFTEQMHMFKPGVGQDTGYLDFPFDCPFDLMGDQTGSGSINLEHYAACDFLLTIYGPCTTPRIVIGNNIYEVKTKLDSGEYMQIDSRKATVIRTRASGLKVSEFDNRNSAAGSVFQKIQPGYNLVSWNGSFGFDIILYIERSEPRWIG